MNQGLNPLQISVIGAAEQVCNRMAILLAANHCERVMSEQMQCMEVWGGNLGVERHFHMPGLELWLYSRPHKNEASGGDVYYLSSCASGRITRLLLADVSGHGTAVADCASQLRNLMRRYVNSISQARFVEDLNQEFTRISDDGKFATAVVGTYFKTTGRLQLCLAGHPPALVYRRQTGQWKFCEPLDNPAMTATPQNTPIGIMDAVTYSQTEFDFATGDMLLAYTDGLTESRGEDGHMLGMAGLLQLVRELDPARADEFVTELLERLRSRGIGKADDDLTVLLARADGTGVRWRNNLLAPFRLFRSARDATRFLNPGARD